MSKITLIGRLGKDAKIKELEDNRFVINFSVAENIKTQRNEPTRLRFGTVAATSRGQTGL